MVCHCSTDDLELFERYKNVVLFVTDKNMDEVIVEVVRNDMRRRECEVRALEWFDAMQRNTFTELETILK